MDEFLQKHAAVVTGVLCGFDRILFRGTLRKLVMGTGIYLYLSVNRILFRDAGAHFLEVTNKIKAASLEAVAQTGRPVHYLSSPQRSKEDVARGIAAADRITDGLICVLTCVEPCTTPVISRDRVKKTQNIVWGQRKCLFIYHYYMHPEFGLLHTRLQTWFPFTITVCLNGREWLTRKLDAHKLGYRKADNCFVWLEDNTRAQQLADEQLKTDWPEVLERLARQAHPLYPDVFGAFHTEYYWTAYQTEWATDVMFKNAEELGRLYPRLVRHGITTFRSPDVLRFLGQYVPQSGCIHGNFKEEVSSDVKTRPEGVRIKHRVKSNSVKLYDKQGSVLRVETTINDPKPFKVFRPKEGGREDQKSWRPLRQGVADLYRRAEVSQQANERYLTALATVENEMALGEMLAAVTHRVNWNKNKVRGLQPFGKDAALLEALGDGSFALNGFRNADIQGRLFKTSSGSEADKRRRAAHVTRLLRILRAHSLIRKVPKTHRYQLTQTGLALITAIAAAKHADTKKLTELAA